MSGATLTLMDVIKGFEDRLAEMGYEVQKTKEDAARQKSLKIDAEIKWANRPQKELESYTSEQLLKEVQRRLDMVRDSDIDEG